MACLKSMLMLYLLLNGVVFTSAREQNLQISNASSKGVSVAVPAVHDGPSSTRVTRGLHAPLDDEGHRKVDVAGQEADEQLESACTDVISLLKEAHDFDPDIVEHFFDQASEQATTSESAELDDDKLSPLNAWMRKAVATIKVKLQDLKSTDLGAWTTQTSSFLGYDLDETLDTLDSAKVEDLPGWLKQWVRDHPWQTSCYIVNGVTFFAPATFWMPLLRFAGFGSKGPGAGSLAAFIQSKVHFIPRNGIFAHLQSGGMGGRTYGVAALNRVSRVASVFAVSVAHIAFGKNATRACETTEDCN